MEHPSGCGLRKPKEDQWPWGAASESLGKDTANESG